MLGLLTLGVSAKSPVTIMTTATELLQGIADAWAQSLGGKIKVRLSLAVESGPKALPCYYAATIGDIGSPAGWSAYMSDPSAAKAEAERQWRRAGSPTDDREMELAKLRAKAAELGVSIVDDQPERDEPVIYERGELAPADTRTEHDKSL